MSLCFGTLIAERVSIRAELARLVPLAASGTGTVLHWRFSQTRGAEKVLPYCAFQAGTIVAGVLVVRFFAPVYTREADLLRAATLYASAVLAEYFDPALFAIGGMISGHTLKHLLTAFAIYQLVRMLRAPPYFWNIPMHPWNASIEGRSATEAKGRKPGPAIAPCAIAMIVGL